MRTYVNVNENKTFSKQESPIRQMRSRQTVSDDFEANEMDRAKAKLKRACYSLARLKACNTN